MPTHLRLVWRQPAVAIRCPQGCRYETQVLPERKAIQTVEQHIQRAHATDPRWWTRTPREVA